jgi:hypothetical protein
MANRKGTNIIYKTLHRTLIIEQHEQNFKILRVNAGAPAG